MSNDIFDKFGKDVYEIVKTQCPNLTCCVTADDEIRIARVMVRNTISREKVLERINNQLSNDFKIKHSDFIIYNNENDIEASFLNLIPQIYDIHKKIII